MVHRLTWKERIAFARLAMRGHPPIRGGSDLDALFPVRVLQVVTGAGYIPGASAYSGLLPSTSPLQVRGSVSNAQSGVSSFTILYPWATHPTQPGDLVFIIQYGSTFTPWNDQPNNAPNLGSLSPAGGGVIGLFAHVARLEPSMVMTGTGLFTNCLVAIGPASGPPGIMKLDPPNGGTNSGETTSIVSGVVADAANITIAAASLTTTLPNTTVLAFVLHSGGNGALSTGSAGWSAIGTFQPFGAGAFTLNQAAAGAVPALNVVDAAGTSGKGWGYYLLGLAAIGN